MSDHAVEGIRHLVCEEPRQTEQQAPEHRRDDAVAEVFRETFNCRAGNAVYVEAHRVAADDVPYRRAASCEPLSLEPGSDRADVFEETALGHQYRNHHDFRRGADQVPATDALDRPSDQRRCADEQDDRNDAAFPACSLAAKLAVELAVEECDRAAGDDDRMRDAAENRRHIAEQPVDGEPGNQQQQRIDRGGHTVLGCRRGSIGIGR